MDTSDRMRDRSPLRDQNDSRDDGRDKDRSRRGDRPSRFGPRNSSQTRDGSSDRGSTKRVFVSNIPYEYGWQDLKDLFRREVGKVSFVELFKDENDKPRGCGIVEFESVDLAKKAVEKMHRFELQNRNLVVKKDYAEERDRFGRLVGRGGQPAPNRGNRDDRRGGGRDILPPSLLSESQKWGNTYGLSPQFLESLGITGPLLSRVFVANLDYKVDNKKLKDVFKLAGKVENAEVSLDKDGKSRGFAIVEFDHPVEAVQAISMFNNQTLYDRKMTVRMDRVEQRLDGPLRLPEGLRSIGMGLGPGGNPLQDVARNLPNVNQGAAGLMGALPSAAAGLGAAALTGVVGQNSLAGLGGAAAGLAGTRLGNLIGASELGLANLASSGALGATGLGAAAGLGANLGAANLNSSASSNFLASNPAFGGSASSNLGSSFGGNPRDFDTLSAALGGGGGGYGSAPQERDYRNSAPSNYVNGPSRTGNTAVPQADPGRSRPTSDTIIVRNLAPTVTWQMLRDKFHSVGDVKFAELRGKDMGLVRFNNEWDAERAVHMMDNSRFEGRIIEVCLY